MHADLGSGPELALARLTVEAEPQQQDAGHVEDGVVAGHGHWLAVGVKAASAWAGHPGTCQACHSAHHVDSPCNGIRPRMESPLSCAQDINMHTGDEIRAACAARLSNPA